MKLQAFSSSYFRGKIHFEDDGKQNYLLLQPVYSYCKMIANCNYILVWKSKAFSDESIKSPAASNNSLDPALNHIKLRVNFDVSCLKQEKETFYS